MKHIKKFKLKKEKRCLNCDIDITGSYHTRLRCKECAIQRIYAVNRRWKKDLQKTNKCVDCKKGIADKSTRCHRCAILLTWYQKNNKCLDCGKGISVYKKKCKKCREIHKVIYKKEWAEKNKVRLAAQNKKWREENKKRVRKNNKLWSKKNSQQLKSYKQKWVEENPEKVKASRVRRRKSGKPKEWQAKQIQNLSDQYVKQLIRISINNYMLPKETQIEKRIKSEDVPQSLIEIKRKELLLKRKLKSKKV